MKRIVLVPSLFAFLFFTSSLLAQTSSFGDTIVHQTFGAGIANPGPPLPPGEINLTYVANTCPDDGQYTVANFTGNCYKGHWTTTKDHTGDPNGYFLLVNADNPGQYFFVDTVSGLCDGQSLYQFSAWIINMQLNTKTNLPNLSFSISYIDSNSIAHDTLFNTGDIPFMVPETWNQYAFKFTKPAGVTQLILKILDNAKGGGGNDFGLDDITFCAAGPIITDSINGVLANTMSVCKENLLTLKASLSDTTYYNPPFYQWQKSIDSGATWVNDTLAGTNSNSFSFFPDSVGRYQYRMSVQQLGTSKCGVSSVPFIVKVFQAVKDTVAASGCDSYFWHGATYVKNGSYTFDTVTTGGAHCDSLTVMNLILKHSTVSTVENTACLSYTWPLSGSTYTKTGNYSYTIIGGNSVGCDSTVTLALTVDSLLVLSPIVGPATDTLLTGEKITLMDNANGGIWVSTNPSAASVIGSGNNATVNGLATGADTIFYITSNICNVDTESYRILVISNNNSVFIPNLFTPTGSINRVFYVRGNPSLFKEVELWIFNSWGGLIHDTRGAVDDPSISWDGTYNGKLQPSGVYVYLVKVTEQNGHAITKKGFITLLR